MFCAFSQFEVRSCVRGRTCGGDQRNALLHQPSQSNLLSKYDVYMQQLPPSVLFSESLAQFMESIAVRKSMGKKDY
eukprot:1788257-Amphidinium_carterae.1